MNTDPPTGDVVVANIDPGHWTAPFGRSLNSMLLADARGSNRIAQHVNLSNGYSDVGASRNEVVDLFLAMGKEWLLWLDSDVSFPPTLVDELLGHADPVARPVVAGLYFGWSALPRASAAAASTWRPPGIDSGWFPMIYDLIEESPDPQFVRRDTFPPNELIRVGGTGGGCVLVHHDVYLCVMAELGHNWYRQLDRPQLAINADSRPTFGEDLSFCLRLAALDIPIHLHTGIQVAHHKGAAVGCEETWRIQERGRVQMGPPRIASSVAAGDGSTRAP